MGKESKNNKIIDYSKIDRQVESIIEKTLEYFTFLDKVFVRDEILRAYHYARDAHEGQIRLSGEPYIGHPVEATLILLELQPDLFTIQSCLLHDVAEDTEKTLDEIQEAFGKEVVFLCAGMEKLSKVRYAGEDRNIGSLRKMFVAMAEDLRVIFIKLSDRIHNMQTLKHHPKADKRERIALETLNIYAPIADRLGLFSFKNRLEEECFKILHPQSYKDLREELDQFSEVSIQFMDHAESEIEHLLSQENIKNYKIDYRIKSIYSIYKKIQKKGLDDSRSLYDIFGIRVVVNDVADCYRVLGLIHNKWSPLPKRFKDYIALPKLNGYKSLHTTVMGLLKKNKKQPAEIQIKTYKMMEYADIGVAAHFEYKEKGSKVANDINWVKDLKDITENLENNDFMSSLKIDVFNDRIFVFTPSGDSINLPVGSTPVDFAYYLHSDLGNTMSVARVNSKVYPFDKELRNGDIIEIITDKSRKPNPFWMSFVKTSKAKAAIRNFLKKEDKDLHRDRGREVMNKYLDKSGLGTLDKDLSILKNIDGKILLMEERWQLLEQVGNFSITPTNLIRRVMKSKVENLSVKHKTGILTKGLKKEKDLKGLKEKKIIVGGEQAFNYKRCACCKKNIPIQIVGHINSKGIITIHKRACKILKKSNRERLLPAYLQGYENNQMTATIRLEVKDLPGILYYITEVLYEMKINIEELKQTKSKKGNVELTFDIKILDYDYLLVERMLERMMLKIGSGIISKEILAMV